MDVFTIGFTKKSAEYFFNELNKNKIKTLIDVRLNNASQLSGFAKKNDLIYFLKNLCGIDYVHMDELAPTKEILAPYQQKKITWDQYEYEFLNLMEKRSIEKSIDILTLDRSCLLCSEDKPHLCHRRLVLEYLNSKMGYIFNARHII
ncbi:DUF488 family protein [Pectobacterium versatile]|uniref:DUF488 domain-containing protein n=1 Tax=Pectobacterium versatile TaxID=2488639 RepID=UPI000D006494|nr:DUF488 domain-containing protein [Pectobacterium versatile]PRI17397.1 hypothetical protein BZY99_22275 [Pectobacterium versatile]